MTIEKKVVKCKELAPLNTKQVLSVLGYILLCSINLSISFTIFWSVIWVWICLCAGNGQTPIILSMLSRRFQKTIKRKIFFISASSSSI